MCTHVYTHIYTNMKTFLVRLQHIYFWKYITLQCKTQSTWDTNGALFHNPLKPKASFTRMLLHLWKSSHVIPGKDAAALKTAGRNCFHASVFIYLLNLYRCPSHKCESGWSPKLPLAFEGLHNCNIDINL